MKDEVSARIRSLAESIYQQVVSGEVPYLEVPARTKDNIVFDPLASVWKYGTSKVVRGGPRQRTAQGTWSRPFTSWTSSRRCSRPTSLQRSGKCTTFPRAGGGTGGKFATQDESNMMAEDLEILLGLLREDMKLRPEENGASVIGNLTVLERNRKGGQMKKINCKDDVVRAGTRYHITWRGTTWS